MEGDNASEQSDATSSSDPPAFSFVTATSLSDFKNPDTMRQVRRAVMHTYLNKAGNDPTSTDVRVTRKRRTKKTSPVRSTDSSEPIAISTPATSASGFVSEFQSDSRVSDELLGLHDGSALFYPQASASGSGMATAYSMPPNIPAHMDPLLEVDPASQRRSRSDPQIFDPEERHPSHDQPIPHGPPDLSAVFNPFFQTGVDTEQLKRTCMSYFQAGALGNDWSSYNATPAEFLAGLSNAAQYHNMRTSPLSGSNRRVTQELLSVLPRILHQSLSDFPEGYSDSNIAAVLQFLNTQLSGSVPTMIPVYQACLKHMVMARGGLDKIGESGVIPIHVSITDMEANLLQDQPFDPMYLTFATRYISQQPPDKPKMMDYSVKRAPDTGREERLFTKPASLAVGITHDLTNSFLDLVDLEKGVKAGTIPATVAGVRKQELEKAIQNLSDDVHRMRPASIPGHDGSNDYVYEAIRLSCLMMTHAIRHRVPFNSALALECPDRHQVDCTSTPELVHAAIIRNGKVDSWGSRASMIYWVFLVASAACHKDEDSPADVLRSAPESRRGSVQLSSANPSHTGSTPQMHALTLHQAQSAPWGSTADQPSFAAAQYAAYNTLNLSLPPAYLGGSSSTDNLAQSYTQPAPPQSQRGKRLRGDRDPSLHVQPATESPCTRTFLVANAVRCSILLRFEHTSRVVYAILKMGRIRDALAKSI